MSTKLTELQADVLRTISTGFTRLRWHSYQTPTVEGDRGRGQVLGCESEYKAAIIPAYTVRSLIRRGLIVPASRVDRQPFKPGVTHRDYIISAQGRAAIGSKP